jgi:tetratricopeptide (TPR) repeat protein
MNPRVLVASLLCLALGVASPALAQGRADAAFEALALGWAHVNYEIKDPHSEALAARDLALAAEAAAAKTPDRAEPLAWQALALLCEADARHNFSSLQLAHAARTLLERAARIDPNAIGAGTIYANLASLYADLPGFPVSFGDARRARLYLDKALAANPAGLDANYFNGDFLYRQGQAVMAIQALEKALKAPPRPGRELADRGRKWEAAQLLDKIRRKEKLTDAGDLGRKPA